LNLYHSFLSPELSILFTIIQKRLDTLKRIDNWQKRNNVQGEKNKKFHSGHNASYRCGNNHIILHNLQIGRNSRHTWHTSKPQNSLCLKSVVRAATLQNTPTARTTNGNKISRKTSTTYHFVPGFLSLLYTISWNCLHSGSLSCSIIRSLCILLLNPICTMSITDPAKNTTQDYANSAKCITLTDHYKKKGKK
jgi:hypothetical protein